MNCAPTRIFLLAATCAGLMPLTAQIRPDQREAATVVSPPVAYVYVSNTYGGTLNQPLNQISAFSVGINGTLAPVAGSPFKADVAEMTVNGKYLFANSIDAVSIESFKMSGNGALQHVQTLNTQAGPSASGCPGLLHMRLDHTGATLYDLELTSGLCEESTFHSYSIDKASGKLTDIATTTPETAFDGQISFTGNNQFAYGSSCNYYRTGYIPYILGYKRNAGGDLRMVLQASTPALKFPDMYCPGATAADPSNHVVIAMEPFDLNNPFTPLGPPQLGIYTADVSGNLSTKSTPANMTSVLTGSVTDLRLSPRGTVLAVAGAQNGVELFHFYGTSHPMQYFTRLLPGEPVDQVLWDNANHLFVLSGYGQLFVYNITAHSVVKAPGSPYSFASPLKMIVQPRTYSPQL